MAGLRLFLSGIGSLVAFLLLDILALAGGWVLRPSAGLIGIILVVGVQQAHAYFEVKDTFGRYVAPQVRDEILSGRVSLDGEIKEVTALFCDLRNFTPLVESVTPEQVVKILNGYFEEMSEAVRNNSGLVLQYVGDEIYAIFGAPLPDPDHARLAVRAGMEMRRRLRMVNQRLETQGWAPLAHGIGIHTGNALAANIGGRDRLSYSLVGDTINLASRLQGLNKKFGTTMIISGSTRLAGIDDHVNLKALPVTRVKGKSEPVEIFEVVEESTHT
jgi:adenylate cyclase